LLDAEIENRVARGEHVAILARRRIRYVGLDSVSSVLLPSDPEGAAHDLYAALRQLDAVVDASVILVEQVPDGPEWLAVRDRLSRAGHESTTTNG
jgi:L-threonylcarbamoyladenylate synthase